MSQGPGRSKAIPFSGSSEWGDWKPTIFPLYFLSVPHKETDLLFTKWFHLWKLAHLQVCTARVNVGQVWRRGEPRAFRSRRPRGPSLAKGSLLPVCFGCIHELRHGMEVLLIAPYHMFPVIANPEQHRWLWHFNNPTEQIILWNRLGPGGSEEHGSLGDGDGHLETTGSKARSPSQVYHPPHLEDWARSRTGARLAPPITPWHIKHSQEVLFITCRN